MRYGGTAAGFTPAEAKAPTLEHHKAQPNRQETEKHQQAFQELCKNRRKKTQKTNRHSLVEQYTLPLLQREHPVRAGQARQEETEAGPRKHTPNSIYRIQTSNQGGNGTTDTPKGYSET